MDLTMNKMAFSLFVLFMLIVVLFYGFLDYEDMLVANIAFSWWQYGLVTGAFLLPLAIWSGMPTDKKSKGGELTAIITVLALYLVFFSLLSVIWNRPTVRKQFSMLQYQLKGKTTAEAKSMLLPYTKRMTWEESHQKELAAFYDLELGSQAKAGQAVVITGFNAYHGSRFDTTPYWFDMLVVHFHDGKVHCVSWHTE